LVEAKPPSCLRIELDFASAGDIDPEHELVLSLIDLVDMAPDQALPLRDEDTEIEGSDGCLHGVGCCEDPGVT
jgi:hypothetical protein